MRVAIQLSGLPDNLYNCYNSLKRQILDRLSNYDIYLVTWDYVSKEYINTIQPFHYELLPFNNTYLKKTNLDKLISFAKNRHKWKTGRFQDKYKSTVLQYWQRYVCNLNRERLAKNYDICIMTRPDLIYVEPLYEKYLEKMLDAICIPTGSDWHHGINDLFAIANPQLMTQYCNLVNNIEKLVIDNDTDYHPEHVLKLYLDTLQLPIKRFSFPLLLRSWRLNY